MADLPESSQWDSVYQLETVDPVVGGPAGVSNQQGKNLANRTAWLKSVIDTVITASGQAADSAVMAQLLNSIKRLSGGSVTTFTFADSPVTLSPAHAGLVLFDTTLGAIAVTYPAASDLPALGFKFRHISGTNSVTFAPDGTDVTEVYGLSPYSEREVVCDGIDAWHEVRALPIGSVIYSPTVMDGCIKTSGSTPTRTLYNRLYNWANTNGLIVTEAAWALDSRGLFAEGDGATTFRLPDLRGEFLRGFDDGRGIDAGRVLGKSQLDELKEHNHQLSIRREFSGTTNTDSYEIPSTNNSFIGSQNWNVDNTGGTETRPRNIAYYAQIKY